MTLNCPADAAATTINFHLYFDDQKSAEQKDSTVYDILKIIIIALLRVLQKALKLPVPLN